MCIRDSTKVELEARTEVKWETYTKNIQIGGRVLGDLAMNHIVPIASKYEAQLLDVYKRQRLHLSAAFRGAAALLPACFVCQF